MANGKIKYVNIIILRNLCRSIEILYAFIIFSNILGIKLNIILIRKAPYYYNAIKIIANFFVILIISSIFLELGKLLKVM